MQFTKLRLLGFKSFVDPTELIIHDGLTGVVGPNGCGKSNLLEALRWVMGENRPTAMRGSGMEDVIFAGAAARPARHFAEVTLTIDNSERLAPASFNDNDKLEVVRRITRDAGSAFQANGKPSRARDVQMLFADASTGSHSPALVRQGQISELINAKPKARRRILEEAAGISGLYQRRHEAELKLKATTTNLERVDDVLGQLESQLNTLARQARQAARYREIGAELRQAEILLLYRLWREADQARLTVAAELTEASKIAARAQSVVVQCAATREAADEALPPLREEEAIAGAVLQRLIVERDTQRNKRDALHNTIQTLTRRLEQLAKDAEREKSIAEDASGTIETLEWEQSALKEAGNGHEGLLALRNEAALQAKEALSEAEAALEAQQDVVARLNARHHAQTRRIADAQTQCSRAQSELEKQNTARQSAEQGLTQAQATLETTTTQMELAAAEAEAAEAGLAAAEAARADAMNAESECRAALAGSEGEFRAVQAEVQALEKLLNRKDQSGDQILDQIRIDPGYESALGAVLGDDLRAQIAHADHSGWHELTAPFDPAPLPAGVAPLAPHVTAPKELARRLAMIGLVDTAEGHRLQAMLQPGQRIVSRDGDVWRWDGLFDKAEETPSAAALRLQQRNRLESLSDQLLLLQTRVDSDKSAFEAAKSAAMATNTAERNAREARKRADQAQSNAARLLSRAEADLALLSGKLETATLAQARFEETLSEAQSALRSAEVDQAALPPLEEEHSKLEAGKRAVALAREALMTAKSAADDLRREGEARQRRAQQVQKDLSDWRLRLRSTGQQQAELADRAEKTEGDLTRAKSKPAEIDARLSSLTAEITRAEDRRKAAADALAAADGALRAADQALREAETDAATAREARARSEARLEAAENTVAQAEDRIEQETELSPNALLGMLEADPEKMPPSEAIETDIARLKRQRDALGAVNLRAEQDREEVHTEFETLSSEKEDLVQAVAKLQHGISNLNREGRERLLAAFDEVNESFSKLFTHLFGGGEAKLELIESDDPLEAGLEIMCQPPGKKLATLSLLSGGEQTLTALSLIFAVFLANPSPICVLDEVDAPLDDANVTRFCDLLDEMTRRTATRFLIITHHAVTMSRMDRLFGVTMAEKGVSQLVSVDLRKAEEIVHG